MLKLHGIKMSNYYSLAKNCLIEKGLQFEEVKSPPSQDEAYLARSPMGKVPALETEEGFVSETFAIADYLEQIQPSPALFPSEAFQRAKMIELIRHIELDIELVARRCLAEAFFGGKVSDEVKEATQKDLKKGMRAVGQLIVCDPYAMGSDFTLADLYAHHSFGLASGITQKIFGTDLLGDYPQIKELLGRIQERDSVKQLAA